MNPLDILKFKSLWDDFTSRHPKFPMFMNAVLHNGVKEGTVFEIQVKDPDGKEFASNLKITKEDMELFEKLKQMR